MCTIDFYIKHKIGLPNVMDWFMKVLVNILLRALAHCSIFDKKPSNAMNAHEHFIRIGYYLAQIDKIINVLSHTCII